MQERHEATALFRLLLSSASSPLPSSSLAHFLLYLRRHPYNAAFCLQTQTLHQRHIDCASARTAVSDRGPQCCDGVRVGSRCRRPESVLSR